MGCDVTVKRDRIGILQPGQRHVRRELAALGLEAYGLGGLVVATLVAMFVAALIRTVTAGRVLSAAREPTGEVAPVPG